MKNNKVPSFDDLIDPTFQALKKLGGSGDTNEIYDVVVAIMNFTDEVLTTIHGDKGNQTQVEYRLAWARTYLKKFGVITNTARGVWVINNEYSTIEKLDKNEVVKKVRSLEKPKAKQKVDSAIIIVDDIPDENKFWKTKLREILLNMNPSAFERLTQRLLRECGLTQVTVTGKSGDGGIDGVGQLKLNGIISFKLAFQCKRYTGSVTSNQIRDFRGSLTTDIEKGLFITTGVYTKDAKIEATTAGKIAIDLIDGEELIDKLAELNIGLNPVISYEIDEKYYTTL